MEIEKDDVYAADVDVKNVVENVEDDNEVDQLTFPEFHFEIEAKVDFPSACI